MALKKLSSGDTIAKGTELFNEADELLGIATYRVGEGDRYVGTARARDGGDYLLVRDHTYVQTAQRAVDLHRGDLVLVHRGRGGVESTDVALVTQVMYEQRTVDSPTVHTPRRPDVLVVSHRGPEFSLFGDDVTGVELLRVERTGIELTDEYGKTDGEVLHASEEK